MKQKCHDHCCSGFVSPEFPLPATLFGGAAPLLNQDAAETIVATAGIPIAEQQRYETSGPGLTAHLKPLHGSMRTHHCAMLPQNAQPSAYEIEANRHE